MAFLVVNGDTVKLLPIDYNSTLDKLIDYVPDMVEKGSEAIKCMKEKNKNIKELKTKIEESIRKDIDKTLKDDKSDEKKEDIPMENEYTEMPE